MNIESFWHSLFLLPDPDPVIPSPYPSSHALFFVFLKLWLSPAKRTVPELVSNCPFLVL
jgi:hypothetical protein